MSPTRSPGRKPHGQEPSTDGRGVALLLVIVILAALITIAVPFMASMRLAEKSSKSFLDRRRAQWIARGALNHAVAQLYGTHDDNERYNLLNSSGPSNPAGPAVFASPDFDDELELYVDQPQVSMPDGTGVSFMEPKGEMWSVQAADEQGKVNVNSATPWLLANLMGVTELSASIDVDETVIPVADPTIFYSDGDPDTIDGYVRIDSEYLAYRGTSEGALTGCMRGIFLEADRHSRGALVYDGRAFKISQHRIHNIRGRLSLFRTPESIRDISKWTKFDAVAEALLYRKLYLDKLKDLGVDEEDIEALIDPGKLIEPEKPEYTPQEKEVNRRITELGLDVEKLRGLFGDEIADRIARRIPRGLANNPRRKAQFEQMTQTFNEFVQQIEAQENEKKERLKKFLPDAFRNIKTLRDILYLETLTAIEFKRLREFITTYSWRSRDWSRPTRTWADIPQAKRGYVNRRILPINDTRHFNRGTLVCISGGGNMEYAIVAGRDQLGRVVTDADMKYSYTAGETLVQAVLRHPVNINSCTDRVLKALLVGLRFEPFEADIRYILRGRQPRRRTPDWITVEEAEALLQRIRQSPPACHDDLNGILDGAVVEGVISGRDRVAVMTNAINPNDPSLVVSTTGFCYKSHNIFSIEATGIINSPAGTQRARHTIRSVVEIAPPMTVTWVLDSQQDFSPGIVRHFRPDTGRKSILQFDDREANKLVTTPWIPPTPWQFPSTSHDPNEGDMRIETGRLHDGNKYINHYDQTMEGEMVRGGFPITTDRQFPVIPERRNRNPKSLGTGYFSCWFKPAWSGGAHYFFDHAKAEYESRVTFFYDGSELILMVCDATLDRIGNTLRAPYTFEPDTWYHIACSWKGVRYGDLAMFVDGKSLGNYENYTRLVGDIDEQLYQITVENASDLPGAPLAIQIDSEAMNVVSISGNTLTVQSQLEAPPPNPPPGWTPQTIRAAVRGTTNSVHYDGAVVIVWGYYNWLREDLRVGGATVAQGYDLPASTPQTMVQRTRPSGQLPPGWFDGVRADETEIPVASTDGFPLEGFILINQEKIYYAGYRYDSKEKCYKFTGCLRGMEGTTAADHNSGASVKLISLKVTDDPGTKDYKDDGYIQLDDEWIRYTKAQDINYQQQYFMMCYGTSSTNCRGQRGTFPAYHIGATKVIPVFNVASSYCGGGDMVTVIDNTHKEPAQINHVSSTMVALTNFVKKKFNQNPWGRLLKWPSGELPTEVQPHTTIGGSTINPNAGLMATIDEVDITTDGIHNPYATHTVVVRQGINSSDTFLLGGARRSKGGTDPPGGYPQGFSGLSGARALEQYGGLIKIDDEIIGVADTDRQAVTFGRLKRGLLGSTPAPHPVGSRIYIIPYPKVGLFDGSGPTGETIPCRDPGATPRQGYIQVARTDGEGEILPYSYKRGQTIHRYRDIHGLGVFRGAFGSPQTGFSAGDLGVYIPFRYHDLYQGQVDSRQGVYFYAVNTFNYAYFRSITWDATIPIGTTTKVQVRINGEPGWDSAPTNKRGGIFEFTDPAADNLIGVMGARVEVRVYMTYQKDAYLTNAWKDTPVIRSITLEYDQPCIVHHYETPEE